MGSLHCLNGRAPCLLPPEPEYGRLSMSMNSITLHRYATMCAALASLCASLGAPLVAYLSGPRPFTLTYYRVPLRADSVSSTAPILLTPKTPEDSSTTLIRLTLRNASPFARRDVQLRIPSIRAFHKSEASINAHLPEIDTWQTPTYSKATGLDFPRLPLLPGNSTLDLWIWCSTPLGLAPPPEVRSATGGADIREAQLLSGWPLFVGVNAWWLASVSTLWLGIWLLRKAITTDSHAANS